MLDSCEYLGSTWDALRLGILAAACVGAVTLLTIKMRPAGFGMLVLGIVWMAFGLWFAKGLHEANESARALTHANGKLLGRMVAAQLQNPRGSGEERLNRLASLSSPERAT